MKLETLRKLVHDLMICLLAGVVLALGLALILFLAGLLIRGFDFRSALVIVRGGLLIVGALELLVSGGLMLFNKDSNKVRHYTQWNRHFHLFGLLPVLMITAAMMFILGSFVDYYLYF